MLRFHYWRFISAKDFRGRHSITGFANSQELLGVGRRLQQLPANQS